MRTWVETPNSPRRQWHTLTVPVQGAERGGRDSWISGAPWTVSLAEWLSSRVCEIWSQGIKTAMFHTPEKCHPRLSYRLPTCAHKYTCPVTSMLTKTCAQTHTHELIHTHSHPLKKEEEMNGAWKWEREYQSREVPKISDYIVSLRVNYLRQYDSKISHVVPPNCDGRRTR